MTANLFASSNLVKLTWIPDMWDRVLTMFHRTLDRSRTVYTPKAKSKFQYPPCAGGIDSFTGSNCMDNKYIYTLAILCCCTWQALCAKINK